METLPVECVLHMIGFLCYPKSNPKDISSLMRVNKKLYNIVRDMPNWKMLCKKRWKFWGAKPKPKNTDLPLAWRKMYQERYVQDRRIQENFEKALNLGERRYDYLFEIINFHIDALDVLHSILEEYPDPNRNLTLKFYATNVIQAIQRRMWINRWKCILRLAPGPIQPVTIFKALSESDILSLYEQRAFVNIEDGIIIIDCFHHGNLSEHLLRSDLHNLGLALLEFATASCGKKLEDIPENERLHCLERFFKAKFTVTDSGIDSCFLSTVLRTNQGNETVLSILYHVLGRYLHLFFEFIGAPMNGLLKFKSRILNITEHTIMTEADIQDRIQTMRILYESSMLQSVPLKDIWLRFLRQLIILTQRQGGNIHTHYKAISQVLLIAPGYTDIAFQKLQLIQNFFREDVDEINDLLETLNMDRRDMKQTILDELNRNWINRAPKTVQDGLQPEFKVGQCVMLSRLSLRGVVMGWERAGLSSSSLNSPGLITPTTPLTPLTPTIARYSYWVLLERNEKRSVTAGSLRVLEKHEISPIEHNEIGKYFDEFVPGEGYRMNKEHAIVYQLSNQS
jgi:hypothetical protein